LTTKIHALVDALGNPANLKLTAGQIHDLACAQELVENARGVHTFIKTHLKRLNKAFKIDWKRPPAHTAIRYILQGLDPADVETVFREHAANLNSSEECAKRLRGR
jgi:transposase